MTALVVSSCFVEAATEVVVSAGAFVVGAGAVVPVMWVEAALRHGAENFLCSHVSDQCHACNSERAKQHLKQRCFWWALSRGRLVKS